MKVNLKQVSPRLYNQTSNLHDHINYIILWFVSILLIVKVIFLWPYSSNQPHQTNTFQVKSGSLLKYQAFMAQHLYPEFFKHIKCIDISTKDILAVYDINNITKNAEQILTDKNVKKFRISNITILPTHETNLEFQLNFDTNQQLQPAFFYQVSGPIPYAKKIKYTEDLPYGKSKVIQKGKDGKFTLSYTKIYSCNLHKTNLHKINTPEITLPTPEIILKGAPPTYRTIKVDGKNIKYYRSLTVWATSYDSSCAGCNNITATGRKLTYGIIAVDPRVIPLHSCIYVPGYGYGQAEDTGGAIKGNKIDLAFEDIKYGWWSARYVTIYLVDCKDAKLPWNK